MFYQVQDNNWRAVLLDETVKMLAGCFAKWVTQLEEDLRLWYHRTHVLSPVTGNRTSNL